MKQMRLNMQEKYVKRRTIAEMIIGQATLLMYVIIFVYGIIK